MTKKFEQVLDEYVKFLNEKIKEGYKVKIQDKNIKEIEVMKTKRGILTDYNVIIKYDNDVVEMMRALIFLEKMIELNR
jgi:hypothetical protein